GVRLSSPGPVLYRARRVGRSGAGFTMYKLRTMHQREGAASAITGRNDPRVFPFGAWLRRTKIDELPQLFNVLRGDMSLVGPRPAGARSGSAIDHQGGTVMQHRRSLTVGLAGASAVVAAMCREPTQTRIIARPSAVDAGPDVRTGPGSPVTVTTRFVGGSEWTVTWGDGGLDSGTLSGGDTLLRLTHSYATAG